MVTTSFILRQTVRRILIALVVILSSSFFRSKVIGDDENRVSFTPEAQLLVVPETRQNRVLGYDLAPQTALK
jgi:hypothetical protein